MHDAGAKVGTDSVNTGVLEANASDDLVKAGVDGSAFAIGSTVHALDDVVAVLAD